MNLSKEELQYLIECVHQDGQIAKEGSGREDKAREMEKKLGSFLPEIGKIKEILFNWDGSKK